MFTDIVGSTGLRDALVLKLGNARGNDDYRDQILDPHNARIRGIVEAHSGFEVKTIGDSFMVAFAEPEKAVACAAAIQRSLSADPIPAGENGAPLAVRIGMHTGQATLVERDGRPDYDGHAVNIAARVESLGGGERILCSGETAIHARNVPGIRLHDHGQYTLKGVSSRVQIFEVLWHDELDPVAPRKAQESLPYPWLTSWVGREREMTALHEALTSARLVTLHGPGGVGKTRLAVETLLAKGTGLPRETVFVPLEGATTASGGLLGALRTALDFTEADAPDVDALSRLLARSERLLLLDNFESVIDEAGLVHRLTTTTPGLRVLVTSQQPLRIPGEKVVELETMETIGDLTSLESYRLFEGLASQRDATWQPDDPAAMREVLEATDGLPYIIELVAAIAYRRTLLQLNRELREHLRDVRDQSPAGREKRHLSPADCLDWAIGRLPADARAALPGLSVFAGGFTDESAEAVAVVKLATLDTLVDAALLRFDRAAGRYSMLSTTLLYAKEALTEDDAASLARAHAHWFIDRLCREDDVLRARGGETQKQARAWIGGELENVQAAVAWSEEHESGLFTIAVQAFALYLRQTGRFSEDVRLMEELLRRCDVASDSELWAGTQNNLGNAYSTLPTGDRGENLTKAIACYEAARRVYTEHDFPWHWAMTQNNLGLVYSNLPAGDRGKNLAKAIACCEAALRVYTERDFPMDWARTQNNLGGAYLYLPTGDRGENLAKAIVYLEGPLRVYMERDFPLDWAVMQNNLGVAYWNLPADDRGENLAQAITYFEAALRVFTERDFPLDWATLQNNLGDAYSKVPAGVRAENLAKAIVCYEAALGLRTERDFPLDWADTQLGLAQAYENRPDDDRAAHVARAIAAFEAAARGYASCGIADKAEKALQQAARLRALSTENA
jgi:class 3 adenylate cyclase/predicted ATPase